MPRDADDETTITGPVAVMDDLTPPVAGGTDAIVVVLHPPGANPGRRFTLGKPEHVVGRRSELELPLDIDSVSRRHARLVKDGDGWAVEDLGSTNGTWVNDAQVHLRHKLRNGDTLRFGEAVVKFLHGSNVERAYHEEIYRMSILDALTGVHNKRFFVEVLEREVARVHRHGVPLALVLFDVDHFKKINDTYGHLAGDSVLQNLCRRLRPRIRREDLLARIGGEEFACVLPDTSLSGARAFAEDLRNLVAREPFLAEENSLTVTISLGVCVLEQVTSPQHGRHHGSDRTDAQVRSDAQELVRRADEKLYDAKKRGRNRVEV
jgi:diguanylate cyclase (GGDEF)-like protein